MLGKRGAYELWFELFGHPESYHFPKPEELPATHPPLPLAAGPSSNSLSSGPTDVSTNVDEPVSIPKELSQVASSSHTPQTTSNDELYKLWLDLVEAHFPSEPESLAARPSSSSQTPGPAGVPMDVEQLVPPIHQELFPVSGPDSAPPSLSD
jgi:hypothetical protein